MPPPTYFPLRWESTGDQWWYASPIDYAAANGHYDLVRELLRLDGNHLIKLTSLRRIRRLEIVWDDDEQFHNVANCRSEVGKKLLSECEIKKGKNSLIGAGYGGWLLYTAASAGDLGFVKELLEKDPLLVFGEGEYGVTDILYAAARGKDPEVFKVVLDFAVSPRFFNRGYGENDAGEIPSAYKLEIMNRALHAAARGGNVKLLNEIICDCSDSVLAYRDRKGSTVLHAAAARGQVEAVKNLISYTELINSTDNNGNTALHVAAHRGHLSVVEALILASPSSVEVTNNAGETFLHTVVTGFQTPGFQRMDRQIELMKNLLNRSLFKVGEIINAKNNEGRTALHLAIIGNIHSDLVELLMTIPCIDVNVRDMDGLTPLDVIRHKPCSSSSEILTRQLISAGGILTSRDYSARRVIASHIKRQSLGGSPGTSFRINDTEIFLYTGIENASSNAIVRPSGIKVFSPEPSQLDSNSVRHSPEKIKKSGSMNYAAQRIKQLLHWPKMKTRTSDRLKKLVEETSRSPSEGVPIPLRQRFSKPSSLANNKRVLSVRSNQPSPMAKKKLASGLMHGVMQAIPTHRSRSSSFSKFSLSSRSSFDGQNGGQVENDIAKPSCSTDGSARNSIRGHGSVNRRLMNQYLCFGGTRGQHIGSPTSGLEPYEIYEQSVLSTA